MTTGYSAEEHAAAWAAYYAQQGYDAATIAAMTGHGQPEASSSSSAGYSGSTMAAGIPSAYTTINTPSTNPYGLAGSGSGYGGGSGSSAAARLPAGTTYLDGDLLAQQGMYLPGAVAGAGDPSQKDGKKAQTGPSGSGGEGRPGKRETVIRKGNGKTWEDPTLVDWDPKWFRLFVGDVSNDVNERTLDAAFSKYPSYCKSKVVRDRLSEKAKYGFIAFSDPEDFLKAWKENDGKYIGNRPIRLSKVKDDKYGSIKTVTVSGRKAKQLDKLKKNKGKPLDGRPVPF